MQKLNVELSIDIPEEYILIRKVEYEELKSSELRGKYWTMRDLEQHTNKKQVWLKENILYPSRFKRELDVDRGGFVSYPVASGQPWVFQATKMAEFLELNFHNIFCLKSQNDYL